MRRPVVFMACTLLFLAPGASAQTPLSIDEAMARAKAQHPSARAAIAGEREARYRVAEARAGYFPRVDVSEAWTRGNAPVFVFSSLLGQRRFTAENFAIDALNHPDAIDNFRTALTIEQPVFDGGLTRLAVRGARLGEDAARAGRARAERDLALAAAAAYMDVVRLDAAVAAARTAVEAAEADLARARDRSDAGMVTPADVLSVEVHLAQMRQELVQATGDLRVARARLNEAIGAPLDAEYAVSVVPTAAVDETVDALEREALQTRPEVGQAAAASALATNAREVARAAFVPQVGLQGGYELNGDDVASKVSSWAVGAQVRVNLFRGFADTARLGAAREAEARQEAERARVEQGVRLEVRAALAQLEAARARTDVGRTAVAQAQETQRILRDRYENGLANVTDVLRAAQAVRAAEFQDIAARTEVVWRTFALHHAVGRL